MFIPSLLLLTNWLTLISHTMLLMTQNTTYLCSLLSACKNLSVTALCLVRLHRLSEWSSHTDSASPAIYSAIRPYPHWETHARRGLEEDLIFTNNMAWLVKKICAPCPQEDGDISLQNKKMTTSFDSRAPYKMDTPESPSSPNERTSPSKHGFDPSRTRGVLAQKTHQNCHF